MASFPFKPHVPREGEPALPIREPNARGTFWDTSSPAFKEAYEKYSKWCHTQPDIDLLIQNMVARDAWLRYRDQPDFNVTKTTARWHRERWEIAQQLRLDGHTDLLEKYWPNNVELRTPPSNALIRQNEK